MTSWYFESTLSSRSSMGGSMMPWVCPAMGEPPGSQTDVVEDARRPQTPKQTVYRVSATTSSAARHPLIRESSIGGRVEAPPASTRTRMLDSHPTARLRGADAATIVERRREPRVDGTDAAEPRSSQDRVEAAGRHDIRPLPSRDVAHDAPELDLPTPLGMHGIVGPDALAEVLPTAVGLADDPLRSPEEVHSGTARRKADIDLELGVGISEVRDDDAAQALEHRFGSAVGEIQRRGRPRPPAPIRLALQPVSEHLDRDAAPDRGIRHGHGQRDGQHPEEGQDRVLHRGQPDT